MGAGGSKQKQSSKSQRAPVESPDSIRSVAFVSLIDLIGEGQIGGLVGSQASAANGAQSVFLDDTALMNEDGSSNFQGMTWDFRSGTQTQELFEGFPDIETPFNVGVQVKTTNAYTFTVNDPNADLVRVIVNLPSLMQQDQKTGDIGATKVQYMFSISNNGGPFIEVMNPGTGSPIITINDKTRAKYQRQHMITLPKPGSNWKIKMTRLTADSVSAYVSNETYLDSYYEIVDQKLTYPNSALFALRIDSSQFDSVPARSYLVDGLYVRVPSNYNAETGSYDGIWNGSMKLAVTSNPAWVLYDLLLNKRYGLGRFILESQISKAKLYEIGRYCDQIVPDGFGSSERRFTINTCIQTQADAYKVISDVASVFRGMAYWNGGQVQFTQDSPTEPAYLFNNSNVVDGLFNWQGSARKDRHSVVHVQWNDPADQYRAKIEYVEDPELIRSNIGYRKAEVVAFGCTSRGQAHRVGLWLLYSEKVETNLITFTVGHDGMLVVPGDVVVLQDQYRAGKRNGGRVKSCTKTTAVLDASVTIGGIATISLMMPDGTFVDRTVQQTGVSTDTVTFTTALAVEPLPNAIWIMTEPDLAPVLARVMSITQGEAKGTYQIGATQHNPNKFQSIEEGIHLISPPTTILDPTFSNPENMTIVETTYLMGPGLLGSKLHISWEGKSPVYQMSWRATIDGATSGWTSENVYKAEYELAPVNANTIYDFQVIAFSTTGKQSEPLVGTYVALGTMNPPTPPTNLRAKGDFRSVLLNWDNPDIIDPDYTEIYEARNDERSQALLIARATGDTYTRSGVEGLNQYFYWVKAVNKRGQVSDFNAVPGTSAIAGNILETDLDRDLAEKIASIDHIFDDVNIKIDAALGRAGGRINDALAKAEAARAMVSIEEMLRDDTDVNIRREVSDLKISLTDNINAQILEVKEVAVSNQQAVARQFEQIGAQFGDFQTGLIEETKARATADDAFTTVITQIIAETTNNHANIIAEYEARVSADEAMANTFTAVLAQTKTDVEQSVTAAITNESNARTTADSALAENINNLFAQQNNMQASFTQQITVLTDKGAALGTELSAVRAATENNQALLSQERTARTGADSALATQIVGLQSKTDDMTAQFASQITTLTNADQVLSTKIDTLSATSSTYDSLKTWNFDVNGQAEGWLASNASLAVSNGFMRVTPTTDNPQILIQAPEAGFNGRLYNLIRVRFKRVAGTTWTGACFYSTVNHGPSASFVKQIADPIVGAGAVGVVEFDMSALTAGGNDWITSTITGIRLDLGKGIDILDIDWISIGRIAPGAGNAMVSETAKTLAETNGKLSAMWNIKLNLTSNGKLYAAGMGIGIETNDQGIAQSEIMFQANRFIVIDPDSGDFQIPFQIQNGVVYINTAMIKDGTITSAKIGQVIQSDALTSGGLPVWALTKGGQFRFNGTPGAQSRIEFTDSSGIVRIQIGEYNG